MLFDSLRNDRDAFGCVLGKVTRADKGSEKPYRLLADATTKSGRVAIAELRNRGKEQLVLIRRYKKCPGA